MPTPPITSARVVALGRYGVETRFTARSWDIELTFGGGQPVRLKGCFRVRSLAIRHLASILAEARAMGLDGRPSLRAACAPERPTLLPPAKAVARADHLRLVSGGAQ